MDTSRVALALARQRLLTAKFELYKIAEPAPAPNGDEHSILVTGKFKYKTVPRVTLKSIAQNTALDPIFAKHEPYSSFAYSGLKRCVGHSCNTRLAGNLSR